MFIICFKTSQLGKRSKACSRVQLVEANLPSSLAPEKLNTLLSDRYHSTEILGVEVVRMSVSE